MVQFKKLSRTTELTALLLIKSAFIYRSGRLGIIVKEFNSAPSEDNKYLDLYSQHAHNRNHKLGAQVGPICVNMTTEPSL